MDDKQKHYIRACKHNLRTFLKTAGYNIDSNGSFDTRDASGKKRYDTLSCLARKLAKKSFDENNSQKTDSIEKQVKKLFVDEADNFNPYWVNEICELYHFPIGKIYSADQITLDQAMSIMSGPEKYISENNYTLFRHSHDCRMLTDEAFMGTFYGYCRNTLNNNEIDNFTLTIGKEQATLVLTIHTLRSEKLQKTLYGKPMHLGRDIIYIVFQSDAGDDMFILSYSWFQIRAGGKLYCRYGSLFTPRREQNRYPQMQAFVMLDNPVPSEHMHYVDGFLRLSQDKIIVPANRYDAEAGGLMATNKKVQHFFEQCDSATVHAEPYYCFSEQVLLAIGDSKDIDFDITAATIMTLKENSINPKVVDFPNNKTYSKFLVSLTADKDRVK